MEELPENWKIQQFKSRHRKQCSNYRTIVFIGQTSKILDPIVVDHLKKKLEKEETEN